VVDLGKVDSHWLAWAAGIVDGEGAIIISRVRTKKIGQIQFYFRMEVQCTCAEAIHRLGNMFGGAVNFKKRANPRWSPYWRWTITGPSAIKVIELIKPWLVIKAPHAELILEFWRICFPDGRRRERKKLTEEELFLRAQFHKEMSNLQIQGRATADLGAVN
jgi:hypothetical protein